MHMKIEEITAIIKKIGFHPKDGEKAIYSKTCNGYVLNVDFQNECILYGDLIIVHDKTTSHLKNLENFVVLECVVRLLEHGYKPENIELERKFPLGHKNSGRVDVSVRGLNDKTYLMIECKTSGKEFVGEKLKTEKNGGQLLSYYQQDKDCDLLCLYATDFTSNYLKPSYLVIECIEDMKKATDVKATHDIWNKQFKDNGIFESDVSPYNFNPKAITIEQLKPLSEDDSGKIFNQFMEVLRHNVISDKGNAFNKLFNLFLCKLADEDKNAESEADFQYIHADDANKTLLLKLNELYSKGVKDYLNKEVSHLSHDEIKKLVSDNYKDIAKRDKAISDIEDALLYQNNEFAFIEVYDKKSFDENAKVVREIVEILQSYKIRYAHKQQFLGDFFELLLNTGFKQESGQFFTPVPLARFMIHSLPIKEIIQRKLDNKEQDFLPFIIDYAMGTGHFLTEAMDEVQSILKNEEFKTYTKSAEDSLHDYKNSSRQFKWAEKFVYGIEKDYRLVKTAKVACFLHGDGLANVIHGDGLDSFHNSNDYSGLLKTKEAQADNPVFDILIANPPYSVNGFKHTVNNESNSFDLYDSLTDQSSEIECLFIERTKQLMKKDGYAAIILPSSILSNGGIYAKARTIILKHFELYAISEFGSNTFMATGTNTVILFMKRRDDIKISEIKSHVEKFMSDLKDVALNNIENIFSAYAKQAYEMEFDDYVSMLKGNDIDAEIYHGYAKLFKGEKSQTSRIIEQEKEKLICYILNAQNTIVLTKSGEKKIEKEFLGYEFSNRRGSEGIKIYKDDENNPSNKLYNANDYNDKQRAAYYIGQRANGQAPSLIDATLQDHVTTPELNDLVRYDNASFVHEVSLAVKKKPRKSRYPSQKLDALIDNGTITAQKGKTITEEKAVTGSSIPVIAGGKVSPYNHNQANVFKACLTISSSGASAGYLWFHETPIWASDCSYFFSNKKEILTTKFLYLIFKSLQNIIYSCARGNAQPHVYISDLLKFNIPLPSLDVQEKMVSRIEAIDNQILSLVITVDYQATFNTYLSKSSKLELLSNHVEINYGYTASATSKDTGVHFLRITDIQNDNVNWSNVPNCEIDAEKVQNYLLSHNDIVFARTGATTGKSYIVKKPPHSVFASYLIKLKNISESLLSDYLYGYFQTGLYWRNINDDKAGASREGFNATKLGNIKVPLPPLNIQQKIVDDIEAQRKTIEQNKKKIEALKQEKHAIMEELWCDE